MLCFHFLLSPVYPSMPVFRALFREMLAFWVGLRKSRLQTRLLQGPAESLLPAMLAEVLQC